MRYGQDNSVFVNMDMYRIENVVCHPFRTATLVDNETIEGQIGEGCRGNTLRSTMVTAGSGSAWPRTLSTKNALLAPQLNVSTETIVENTIEMGK